jgi:hypothetical protein
MMSCPPDEAACNSNTPSRTELISCPCKRAYLTKIMSSWLGGGLSEGTGNIVFSERARESEAAEKTNKIHRLSWLLLIYEPGCQPSKQMVCLDVR